MPLPIEVGYSFSDNFALCEAVEIISNYIKVNAPVAGRLRNFCFSFESRSLINQYKLIALFNIIIQNV